VPLLWVAHCALIRISEMSVSIHELAALQTSIALIVSTEHTARTIGSKINRMIAKFNDVLYDEDTGRPKLGNTITVAGGEKFEFPAVKVDLDNLLHDIRKDQRFIGSLVAMPDWMISGDTSVANFSSSVTSEGPFAKRMRREQRRQAKQDIDLLWQVIGSSKYGDDPRDGPGPQLQELRRQVMIEAVGPLINERQMLELTSALQNQIGIGIESKRGAAAKIGNDYEQVKSEREAELDEMDPLELAAMLPQPPGGEPGEGVRDTDSGSSTNNPQRGDAADPNQDLGRVRESGK